MRCAFVLALAGVLMISGCKREAAHARVDAALAPLVPSDAVALACLRLDKLKDTPFYAKYVEGKKIPQLEQFAEQTGLDVRKDIWELLFVARSGDRKPMVMIRGKFGGQFGLEPEFDKPGIQKMNYKGYYIIYSNGPGVMFMNTGAAVAGEIDDLKAVIDNRDKPTWGPPKSLLNVVGTLPGSAQFWFATEKGGSLLPEVREDGPIGSYLKLAQSLGVATMSVDLRQGIDLAVEGRYPDEASAKKVQEAVKGVIGMARLQTPDSQADLLRLYDAIRVGGEDGTVRVTVKTPFDLAEKLISLLPGSRRPGS